MAGPVVAAAFFLGDVDDVFLAIFFFCLGGDFFVTLLLLLLLLLLLPLTFVVLGDFGLGVSSDSAACEVASVDGVIDRRFLFFLVDDGEEEAAVVVSGTTPSFSFSAGNDVEEEWSRVLLPLPLYLRELFS